MTDKFVELHDGYKIPIVGLGVYQASPTDTYESCLTALKLGYRHIDTAALYGNEIDVGRALKDSGISRSDIFITTKLWNDDHGYEKALKACELSMKKLNLEYIDLYLIHSPVVGAERLETWKALEKLKKDGRVRSIGVSNYNVHHLNEILEQKGGQIPVVNQIEMHPFLYRTRKELIEYCREHQIVIEAYSPLTRGKRLGNSTLQEVGDKHGKTSAQVLLRWCVEKGFVTLPKSVHEQRLRENFGVFDWHLDKTDIEALDRLDNGQCVAWNPLEWE